MSDATRDTSERITPGRQLSLRQHVLYLRHLFAYEYAKSRLRVREKSDSPAGTGGRGGVWRWLRS